MWDEQPKPVNEPTLLKIASNPPVNPFGPTPNGSVAPIVSGTRSPPLSGVAGRDRFRNPGRPASLPVRSDAPGRCHLRPVGQPDEETIMRMRLSVPLTAAVVAVLGWTGTTARAAHCGCTSYPASTETRYETVRETVMKPVTRTVYRDEVRTEMRTVTETQMQCVQETVNRPVKTTVCKDVAYTVCRPVTRCVPVCVPGCE